MDEPISVGHWLPDPLETEPDLDGSRILDEDAAASQESQAVSAPPVPADRPTLQTYDHPLAQDFDEPPVGNGIELTPGLPPVTDGSQPTHPPYELDAPPKSPAPSSAESPEIPTPHDQPLAEALNGPPDKDRSDLRSGLHPVADRPQPPAPSQGPEMPPESPIPAPGAAGPLLPPSKPPDEAPELTLPPDSPPSSPDYLDPAQIRQQALERQRGRWNELIEHRRDAAGLPPETPPEPAGPQVQDRERAGIGMPEPPQSPAGGPLTEFPTVDVPDGVGMGFDLLPSPLGDRADGPKGMPKSARELFSEDDLKAEDLGPPDWRGESGQSEGFGEVGSLREMVKEIKEKVEKLQDDEENRYEELLEACREAGTVGP